MTGRRMAESVLQGPSAARSVATSETSLASVAADALAGPAARTRARRFSAAKAWLAVADAAMLVVAVWLAHTLGVRYESGGSNADSGDQSVVAVVAFAAILLGLVQQRAYKARYLALRRHEFARVVRGVVFGLVATIVVGYLFGIDIPQWLIWVLPTATVLICLDREIARRVFNRLRHGGRMVRQAIVVGANNEADELSVMLMGSRDLGYQVVGHIDTTHHDGEPLPWRTVLASVERMVQQTHAGNVIIAASATTLDTAGYLTRRLTDSGVHVEMCMPLPDIDVTRLQLRPLGRFPVFYVEPVDRSGWRPCAKRAFDTAFAALCLLAVSPIMAVAAIAIKVGSPGPVIFRQKRVGRNGELFNVLKLRTMVVDAEARLDEVRSLNEATGPVFKIRKDPRITPIGRVLRKFSIDEFPQLWNVIRGEMSLVGPRPALPAEMDTWTTDLLERLRVRPGITGMWQVNGRTDSSGSDYVRLDLYYVDNWSLLMDMIIMAKTVPVVVSGRGAY